MANRSYSLGAIVARRLPRFTGYKNLVNAAAPEGMSVEDAKDVGDFHLSRVPLEDLVVYNGADCDVTKRIELATRDKVPASLVRVYTEASFTVDAMQRHGPLLDYPHCRLMLDLFTRQQAMQANRLRKMAENPELNPNSTPQVTRLLFDQWRIAPPKDRDGEPIRNTQKETLELILNRRRKHNRRKHKGVAALQAYRLAKNRRERAEAFLRSADAHDGRVSTFWWLHGARTGRLSSGGGTRVDKRNLTNLQNQEKIGMIRDMLISDLRWRDFVAQAEKRGVPAAVKAFPDLKVFVAFDESQMELRVLAHLAGEQEMIRLFRAGGDIHAEIGALWSGWTAEEIRSDENKRTRVKRLHFGVVYGKTADSLYMEFRTMGLKTTRRETQQLFDRYFERFERVRSFGDEQIAFAEEQGYVENPFGFRTPIDVHKTSGSFWKNQAKNAVIQGTAHQILLCAMALMHREPERFRHIELQQEIHDELVTVTELQHLATTLRTGKRLLERDVAVMTEREFGVRWSVPFVSDPKIGLRFGSMVDVKPGTGGLLRSLEKVVAAVADHQKELDGILKRVA